MKRMHLAMIGVSIAAMGCAVAFPGLLGGDSIANKRLVGVLFVNEVSADNPDEDDWVELYNSDSDAIDLEGFFLSDDPANPAKWSFPAGANVLPGSYCVVICDGSNQNLRTSFQLRAGAEGLYLTAPEGTTIDSLVTVPSTGTGSYGRATDGSSSWAIFVTPTKGSENR